MGRRASMAGWGEDMCVILGWNKLISWKRVRAASQWGILQEIVDEVSLAWVY
jgi:hypothetical protein